MVQWKFRLHYWPVLTCGWFITTFIISYLVSVLGGNVYAFFPFISDTGSIPPESCIFGQMMNIGAVILAITVYIRYRQVDFAINSGDVDLARIWNNVAFWFGGIMSLGISMVGNFQQTAISAVHLIAASFAFGVGFLYLLVQTRISFAFRQLNHKYPKYGVGRNLLYLRVFLTCWFLIFSIGVGVCGPLAFNQFDGLFPVRLLLVVQIHTSSFTFINPAIMVKYLYMETEKIDHVKMRWQIYYRAEIRHYCWNDIIWWTEDHGGFDIRLAATFSEWLMVLGFMFYALTVTSEFKSLEYEEIRFRSKCIDVKSKGPEEPE